MRDLELGTFTSDKQTLSEFLKSVEQAKLQLPDFQRGWVWDDERIKSLLANVSREFPIGAVMMLEAGGDVRFQSKPIEVCLNRMFNRINSFLMVSRGSLLYIRRCGSSGL